MRIRIHAMATTTPAIRKAIQSTDSSIQNIELAKKYGIHRNTVSKWRRRNYIEDRSAIKHNLGTSYDSLEERVMIILRKDLKLSLDEIYLVLKECKREIARSSIHRCLQRHKLSSRDVIKELEEKEKKEVKQFTSNPIGFVHIDTKNLPRLDNDKHRHYLYVARERSSRWAFVRIKEKHNANSSAEFLKEVIKEFPNKIIKILTDNGQEYTDRFFSHNNKNKQCGIPSGNHLFDKVCKEYNIEHRLTKPYSPQTNGMVERFNRQIEEWLQRRPYKFKNLKDMEEYLYHMVNIYNNTKLRVIKYKTPMMILQEQNEAGWYRQKTENQKSEMLWKGQRNTSSYDR